MPKPTLSTVHVHESLIHRLVANIRSECNGAALVDTLSSHLKNALEELERHTAEVHGGKQRLLEERLVVAVEQYASLRKEHENLCSRYDCDFDFAVRKWKDEVAVLHQRRDALKSQKEGLEIEWGEVTARLALNMPVKDHKHAEREAAYTQELGDTIRQLESHLAERDRILADAHSELQNSIADMKTVSEILASAEKENKLVADEVAMLKADRNALSDRQITLNHQIDVVQLESEMLKQNLR